jgi:hypothetical protein
MSDRQKVISMNHVYMFIAFLILLALLIYFCLHICGVLAMQ